MSTPEEKKKNKISVRTADGEVFELDDHLSMESITIKAFFEDFEVSNEDTVIMPLPNVESWVMVKIIEFSNKIRELEAKYSKSELISEAFDAAFKEDLTLEKLVWFLGAVNYLDMKNLQMILCSCMADRMKTKSLEYARYLLGVESDYTSEEEAEIRRVYGWAFNGPEIEQWNGPSAVKKVKPGLAVWQRKQDPQQSCHESAKKPGTQDVRGCPGRKWGA